jgi:hypothetical protein
MPSNETNKQCILCLYNKKMKSPCLHEKTKSRYWNENKYDIIYCFIFAFNKKYINYQFYEIILNCFKLFNLYLFHRFYNESTENTGRRRRQALRFVYTNWHHTTCTSPLWVWIWTGLLILSCAWVIQLASRRTVVLPRYLFVHESMQERGTWGIPLPMKLEIRHIAINILCSDGVLHLTPPGSLVILVLLP